MWLIVVIGILFEEDNYVIDGVFIVDECIVYVEWFNMDGGLSFLVIDYFGFIEKLKVDRNDLVIVEIICKLK